MSGAIAKLSTAPLLRLSAQWPTAIKDGSKPMEPEDDDLLRPPPPSPYRVGTAQLRVPVQAFSASLQLLQAAGRRESGLFWYGPRDADGSGSVSYVVAPQQRMSWGNYSVTTDA